MKSPSLVNNFFSKYQVQMLKLRSKAKLSIKWQHLKCQFIKKKNVAMWINLLVQQDFVSMSISEEASSSVSKSKICDNISEKTKVEDTFQSKLATISENLILFEIIIDTVSENFV